MGGLLGRSAASRWRRLAVGEEVKAGGTTAARRRAGAHVHVHVHVQYRWPAPAARRGSKCNYQKGPRVGLELKTFGSWVLRSTR